MNPSGVPAPSNQPVERQSHPQASSFVKFPEKAVELSIGRRFEEVARLYPARLAVATPQARLTYSDLDRVANHMAAAILEQAKSDSVAFLLPPGVARVVALLGAMKAGKIAVPLDPDYPRSRTAYLLEDSQASMIVADASTLDLARKVAGKRPVFNIREASWAAPASSPAVTVTADQPAILLYTSGSTGYPKGVLHTHRSVLHFTLRYTNTLHIGPADRVASVGSYSFAAALADIFMAVLNGAGLYPYDFKSLGPQMGPWLQKRKITIFHLVATVFRHVTKTLAATDTFPDLRLILLGGEEAFANDVELYHKHFGPACQLANLLGCTEASICTAFLMNQQTPLAGGRVPAGRPVEGMEVLVLDDAGREVPAGTIGQLAFRSRYLAQGYWRNPELTDRAFKPDPQGGGLRTYRTGDMARLGPDGCLEYIGRQDNQVKVRGQRVEMGEVEAAILALENVKEAAVIKCLDRQGEPGLLAYIVPVDRTLTVEAVRTALAQRLPPYMIPAAIVWATKLPETPSGKLDRQALPVPLLTADIEKENLDAPAKVFAHDPLEQTLLEIWEKALNVRPIGVHDNFFDLGGNSLLVFSMLAEVEKRTGQTLTPDVLLQGATIRHLARMIMKPARQGAAKRLVEMQGGDPAQRFYYLHGDYGGGGFYCRNLADLLPGVPFTVLQPHGLSEDKIPGTLEGMAAEHLAALRAVQPQGPYRLGGYCNGAMIALEMAHRLRADGQQVDLLVMGDPTQLAVEELREQFLKKGKVEQADLAELSATVDLTGLTPGKRRDQLQAAYVKALASYQLKPYDGRLVILIPVEKDTMIQESAFWSAWAPQAQIHFIPGDHLTALTKHITGLADILRPYLAGKA